MLNQLIEQELSDDTQSPEKWTSDNAKKHDFPKLNTVSEQPMNNDQLTGR